jgi:hypothetical protein
MAVTKQQADSATGQPFEVLDLQQSTEFVQALEARGDFKFKGIFKVFQTILDWTGRFSSTNILPSSDQIAKDVEIVQDRPAFQHSHRTQAVRIPLI